MTDRETAILESKRADSLALAYREQQGENDVLRAKLEAAQRERDLFRDAWAKAQVRLDCGVDAADALRDERADVVAWLRANTCGCYDFASAIERGYHRQDKP